MTEFEVTLLVLFLIIRTAYTQYKKVELLNEEVRLAKKEAELTREQRIKEIKDWYGR